MHISIDALPAFQINTHVNEKFPSVCGGIIISNDHIYKDLISVADSFALPSSFVENGVLNLKSKECAEYTHMMSQKLSKIGYDSSVAGWYISSSVSSIFDAPVLENMLYLHKQNPESFVIVNDVALSRATNHLDLRAFTINSKVVTPELAGKSLTELVTKNNISINDLVEELEVSVTSSEVIKVLLDQAFKPEVSGSLIAPDQQLLERHADAVIMNADDIYHDQNLYQRVLGRERNNILQWIHQREQQNRLRKAKGQEPLPLDEWKQHFNVPDDSSKLDAMLLNAQLDERCKQVEDVSSNIRKILYTTVKR